MNVGGPSEVVRWAQARFISSSSSASFWSLTSIGPMRVDANDYATVGEMACVAATSSRAAREIIESRQKPRAV